MQPVAVKVDIYGTVRDLVKENRIEVLVPEGDGATFRDVLEKVAERFGPDFRERLYAGPGQLGFVKVYLRGRLVDNLDEPLPKEDGQPEVRLIFLAVVGGG
jgi:molybdopterin converting factor small subunit